ncbi:J domain-containing protein [Desulfonauticus submarinus]
MSKEDILEAKKILDLPDKVSLKEIKQKYYMLLKRWHPDRCKENQQKCKEMTQKITIAYSIILKYFEEYKIDFSEKALKDVLSPEEWWFERFGHDPVWGKKK